MTPKKPRGLGRGLNALINDAVPPAAEKTVKPPAPVAESQASVPSGSSLLPLASITANPWQPRRSFTPESLEELVASVRKLGVLQPLLVRRAPGPDGETEPPVYQLIAGERRLRAAVEAGLSVVPVRIMEIDDQESLELALIENLQREDLNIIDEAEGYHQLMEQFDLTQQEVAEKVGKARATVANALRLLKLGDACRAMLAAGSLSTGHAKALLALDKATEQETLAKRVLRDDLSVRETERLVARRKNPDKKRKSPRPANYDLPEDYVKNLTDRLHGHFGTGVRVEPSRTLANGKHVRGRIEIDYYSNDDLDRLLGILGLSEEP